MDGDGCRTDELYERSVVECHALTLDNGGRNEVELVWVKLVVDAERVSSESESSETEEMTRDVGVPTEVASSVIECGNGESRLRVSVSAMFNDVGVATETALASADGINGDGEGDRLDNGRAT